MNNRNLHKDFKGFERLYSQKLIDWQAEKEFIVMQIWECVCIITMNKGPDVGLYEKEISLITSIEC